jgi:hypothetical protein
MRTAEFDANQPCGGGHHHQAIMGCPALSEQSGFSSSLPTSIGSTCSRLHNARRSRMKQGHPQPLCPPVYAPYYVVGSTNAALALERRYGEGEISLLSSLWPLLRRSRDNSQQHVCQGTSTTRICRMLESQGEMILPQWPFPATGFLQSRMPPSATSAARAQVTTS